MAGGKGSAKAEAFRGETAASSHTRSQGERGARKFHASSMPTANPLRGKVGVIYLEIRSSASKLALEKARRARVSTGVCSSRYMSCVRFVPYVSSFQFFPSTK